MQRYTIENDKALYNYCLENGIIYIKDIQDWKQFKNCQAWYKGVKVKDASGDWEHMWILQSYNTIVAVYNEKLGELVRLGKWTRTTSKQTTQWGYFMEREHDLRRWRIGYGN